MMQQFPTADFCDVKARNLLFEVSLMAFNHHTPLLEVLIHRKD